MIADGRAQTFQHPAGALGSQEAEDRSPDQLVRRVARDRRGPLVREDEASLRVHEKDGVVDVLGDEPVTLLGLAQGPREMLTVERLLECRYQLIHLERLHQIGEGVAVDGLERCRKRGVSRHENDLEIRRGQSKRLQELDARDVRETDIDDRGVEAHRADLLEALRAAHGAPDHEPFRLEHVADRLAHPGLVVDNEDPSRRIHSRTLTTTMPSRRTFTSRPTGPGGARAPAPPRRARSAWWGTHRR